MSLTESETTDQTTTIALADVGADVPDETTVEVRQLTDEVYEVIRNGHTFTVEVGLWRIAEVTLEDFERPERVPDWLAAVMKGQYNVREVRL